jgi:Mg-chelatase subunit ChlI
MVKYLFNFPKLFQYGILPQPPRGLLYIFFDVIKSIEDRFGKNHKYYKMI